MKRISEAISILVLPVLVSCAALGSSSKIHDANRLHHIATISVASVEISEAGIRLYKKAGESANKFIRSYIERNTSLKIVSNKTSSPTVVTHGLSETKDSVLHGNDTLCDAVLYSSLRLMPKQSFGMTWFDAELKVRLEDARNGKQILESCHNTTMGNSYMSTPQPDQVISDAVKGALKPLKLK